MKTIVRKPLMIIYIYSYGSPHMAAQKQDDQLERTFSSYVRIQDVVLKTYLGRWTIGRSGERGSGISVLPARYDDDDDIYCHHVILIAQFPDPLLPSIPLSHYSWQDYLFTINIHLYIYTHTYISEFDTQWPIRC